MPYKDPAKNRQVIARWHRRKKSGLTEEAFQALKRSQSNKCAICKQPEKWRGRHGGIAELSIDHDHKTGAFRGLLCKACNAALGLVKEDPFVAVALANYLIEKKGGIKGAVD
jgi:hypothetical protein